MWIFFVFLFIALYALHWYKTLPYSHIPGHTQFFQKYFPKLPFLNPYGFKKRFTDIDIELRKNLDPKVGITKQIYAFGMNRVIISDPDLVKEILITRAKEFPKPQERYSIFEDYGPNILSSVGEEWRKQRKLCDPAFSQKNLEYLTEVSYDATMEQISKWKDGDFIDVEGDISLITFDIISKAGFGYNEKDIDVKKLPKNIAPFKETIKVSVQPSTLITKFLVPPTLLKIMEYLPFDNIAKKLKTTRDDLEVYLKLIIQNRKESKEKENYDLLTLLLQSNDEKEVLTNQEVISNTFIFLLAGHETTATSLSWTFYELAKNPKLQEECYQEVVNVLKGKKMTYSDYDKLELINGVVQESLRLHPPVHGVIKENPNPLTIGGVHIPEKTIVLLNFFSLQRDPRYWKNPLEFNPHRWKDEKPQFGTYFPFSGGQRKCIGFSFSLLESCIILATIIQNFTIHMTKEKMNGPPPERTNGIVGKPIGLEIFLQKRKN